MRLKCVVRVPQVFDVCRTSTRTAVVEERWGILIQLHETYVRIDDKSTLVLLIAARRIEK